MTTESAVPSGPSRPCPECGTPMKCEGREWGGGAVSVLLLVVTLAGAAFVGKSLPDPLWLQIAILALGLSTGGCLFVHFMRQCFWECEPCDTWIVTRGKPHWAQSKEPGCCPVCQGALQPRGSAFMGMTLVYLVIGVLGGIAALAHLFLAIPSFGTDSGGAVRHLVKAGVGVVGGAVCVGTAAWRFGCVARGCPKCGIYVLTARAAKPDTSRGGQGGS